ncbi:MAG TPA: OB-fold domain-containing protein [Acidimicrobiales bacterium]|nr:OB-fold domain-containing protein [Acidimicrobiales bacterium]
MSDPSPTGEVLRAPHVLDYTYTRSVGPVIGAFLTGLRQGRILAARADEGRVVVPPTEYDPLTGRSVGELVEVGPGGVVASWAWAAHPTADQPLDHPFAWALVTLDGASTSLLHVVDAGSPSAMSSGMRVRAEFRPEAERRGHLLDISSFVPEDAS